MILKLNPRWPVVWRTPQNVQIGVDPPIARLDQLTTAQERMLAALVVGITESGLGLVCDLPERESLLEALHPALLASTTAPAETTVAVSGSGPTVARLVRLLGEGGRRALVAADVRDHAHSQPTIAVIVGTWVLPLGTHSYWLRRDVPHLPIVFGDSAVTIGPLIEPGYGPCLTCLELHRTGADPAWPAIASQLSGMRGAIESPLLAAEAAAIACRLIDSRIALGPGAAVSIRVDATTGHRTTHQWQPHPSCGCLGIDRLLDDKPTAT